MITIKDLTKKYHQNHLYQNYSNTFTKGIHLIQGKNGSGKSTLLKMITGLERNDGGEIQFDSSNFKQYLSYLPDTPLYFDSIRVEGFLNEICKIKRISKKEISEAIKYWKIDKLLDQRLGQLSLGQKKRVFLSLSFSHQIKYYLFDEPFNGLDSTFTQKLWHKLKSLENREACTLLTCHTPEALKGLQYHTISLDGQTP